MVQTKLQARAWYKKNKARRVEKVVQNIARQRAKRARLISDFKSKPCMDCGRQFHPCVMDFDHRPGTKKLGDVGRLIQQGWSWKRVVEEVEKCDVVCSNCHRVRTHVTRKPSVVQ